MYGNRRGGGWSEDHKFHAVIDINKLAIVRGSLPPSKSSAVIHWATERQEALLRAFVEAMAQRRVGPIK